MEPTTASVTTPAAADLPGRTAWIDATAGIAGDMLLAALVDAGADLDGVQAVLEALIPGSVRFHQQRVDRCGQQAVKVDVEVLVDNPPHRTWSSIRALLEQARTREDVPARTVELALAAFSLLAEAEAHAHGIPADQVHFHEVGSLDSLADVIGACEAWRQLGIEEGAGSVIAVGSGRIRAAHGDIPVPVPAVARLAIGWPTVAGEMLPARGHGHSHAHAEAGQAHWHTHAHAHAHAHAERESGKSAHSHRTGDAEGTHPHEHDHDHEHDHPHDDAHLPAHAVGGPHAAPSRPVPAGVAPGIGELATPTGVALIRALASTAGPQPALLTEAVGVGAGTKDTPGRPNVVRVIVGRRHEMGAATGAGAAALAATLAAAESRGGAAAPAPSAASAVDRPRSPRAGANAHDTPAAAVQLEANVDDLDPRLWPGVITALLAEGALDAWLTPIVMKHGRPALTMHALVRESDSERLGERIMTLSGSLGVRRHRVERQVRTRTFEQVSVQGHPVQVKIARDASGAVQRVEPEFRDVQALASALGISEREALALAREQSAHAAE
ncbi:LarC family nickel insertion protein [Brachybacterium sp. JHP9]|uniref:Pyridinium-3,5-bisthiocarboxylic acid mononucleotide nickel insertion protein n=1 Tax=Brachybacterium equifaecis TaxID=2910770 RepID=A0ABT0R2J0_9MICO|nr:LarC family nickel insertion protein [Brachybacterium equifaecis]MCL6423969.1 LarC family nickel insertion protein [Brachybacterium equifaecis]